MRVPRTDMVDDSERTRVRIRVNNSFRSLFTGLNNVNIAIYGSYSIIRQYVSNRKKSSRCLLSRLALLNQSRTP